METAIFTVTSDEFQKSLLSILSSSKYNPCPHYIFYEQIDEAQVQIAMQNYPQIKFMSIEAVADINQYQIYSKYLEHHHHPATLFVVDYLQQYSSIVYISNRIHVTGKFEHEQFIDEQVFLAPPLASPFNDKFVSNKFLERHNIRERVFLSEDLVVINPKQFIKLDVLARFAIFTEELYYQSKLDKQANAINRIPSLYAFNLFVANNIPYKYLPQNYMLDISYTIDYQSKMLSFYQPSSVIYLEKFDHQMEFADANIMSDVYHLEYHLFVLEFLKELKISDLSVINHNLNFINKLIIKRNIKYQQRLNQ